MKQIILPIHLNGKKVAELTWLNICGEHIHAGYDLGLVSIKQTAKYPDDRSTFAMHSVYGVHLVFSMKHKQWQKLDGDIDSVVQQNDFVQSLHWVELEGLDITDPIKILEFLKQEVKNIEYMIND